MQNGRKVGEDGMTDPYEKVLKFISETLSTQSKMVLWIAERTLSAKDFQEFIDEFTKKPGDKRDKLLELMNQSK